MDENKKGRIRTLMEVILTAEKHISNLTQVISGIISDADKAEKIIDEAAEELERIKKENSQ